MTGFVFIFFVLMILLGFDILTWGLSLVLLGLTSTVITEVLCADPATAAKITDAIIGVLILGFLVYFVIMLFLFPFFGWLLRFASARFRFCNFWRLPVIAFLACRRPNNIAGCVGHTGRHDIWTASDCRLEQAVKAPLNRVSFAAVSIRRAA